MQVQSQLRMCRETLSLKKKKKMQFALCIRYFKVHLLNTGEKIPHVYKAGVLPLISNPTHLFNASLVRSIVLLFMVPLHSCLLVY